MITFKYIGRDKTGKIKKGKIEAENSLQAMKLLQNQELFVISLKEAKKKIFFLKKKVPVREKIIFTGQLAMMIRSGLPLIEALESLGEETASKRFAQIIEEIREKIKGGESLSLALEKHPEVFPSLYIAVIKSGEKSGKLEEVLGSLAEQLEKEEELKRKVRSALIYPILVLSLLLVVGIIILIFLIPQLKKAFEDVGASLPLSTQILLHTSDILRKWFWVIFLIIGGGVFVGRFYLKKIGQSKTWDWLKLKIPIFGNLLKKIYLAHFSRTLGTLISAGLPLLEAIKSARDVIGHSFYKESLTLAEKKIEEGSPFSLSLKGNPLFPPIVPHLLSLGEKTGQLDKILFSLADFFDQEVDGITRNLSLLLEPILVIIMGIGVGLMIASVLMPIYNLLNVI